MPGTTSACAENTTRPKVWRVPSRNYLRMRGEYGRPVYFDALEWELPPHARRILSRRGLLADRIGTTSACAENTASDATGGFLNRNYLRMRGEYYSQIVILLPTMELPPHARRIPAESPDRAQHPGTTSACAENTAAAMSVAMLSRNYLRMRGEYRSATTNRSRCWELPPHARRIRDRVGIYGHSRGTTSACAENTPVFSSFHLGFWNYLRMRGEYTLSDAAHSAMVELPPHARRIP